jgi:lipopolysaccharide transport system ATP-binding protein
MSDLAIRVENLGKQYYIGRKQEKFRTLRDLLADSFRVPFRRARELLRGQAVGAAKLYETIWALKDISFEVKRGEVVGVIGANGAGKSTLLKVLSRITEPTEGFADVYGRVGSLLEVGTGFHQELTGRENVYLNGAILGMARSETERKFDAIVAFSGVERFIDTPVKHYSSGMYLRLAFAVAAHLEPEILLVDEVLAVGDATFQKKCLSRMESIAEQGRTVLFVSHNMGAIVQLCERALWLEGGQLKLAGPSSHVVASYLSSTTEGHATWRPPDTRRQDLEVRLLSARLLCTDGGPATVVDFDSQIKVEVAYEILDPVRNLFVGYHLFDSMGNIVFESLDTDSTGLKGQIREPGHYTSTCKVPDSLLKPGHYQLALISFIDRVKIIEHYRGALAFDVSEVGYHLNAKRYGVVTPVFEWNIQKTLG